MNNMDKTEEAVYNITIEEENFSARMLAYYDAILKKISRKDTEERRKTDE